jgi:hypothetical protein
MVPTQVYKQRGTKLKFMPFGRARGKMKLCKTCH